MFSKEANEEMRLYNLTMKVNRLEMLKANIGLELISGHDELQKFMGDILQGRTERELKRQAGILGETVQNNAKNAHVIVNASFHNATYSERVWGNQTMLKSELSKLLQSGLIQGKNPRALAKELGKTFDTSKKNLERLMRTELARVQTEAQKQSFIRNGFEEYTFLSLSEGSGTCPICLGLNGKHFKVKYMMPGTNAPPMHPYCRCSTSAYEDSKEYEAWLDFLDKGGTTEQWNKLKVKPKNSVEVLEKLEEYGTIPLELGTKELLQSLSGDVSERSYQVDKILNKITSKKSLWSGKTIIKTPSELLGALGVKEWNCDITLRADSSKKTALHEHLHARSISHFDEEVYKQWKNIEEATVEMFAQEICKKNGISYKEAYVGLVKELRILNSILRIHDNDYDFAKELFEIKITDRYLWLRKKADELIKQGVLSTKTVKALNQAVETFRRGV
ncbi:MAG: minor capsid protein [Erysipelotrichaceae bacterium]|nr:minor capsid protein [Erysipelotrichaceae bacterium]